AFVRRVCPLPCGTFWHCLSWTSIQKLAPPAWPSPRWLGARSPPRQLQRGKQSDELPDRLAVGEDRGGPSQRVGDGLAGGVARGRVAGGRRVLGGPGGAGGDLAVAVGGPDPLPHPQAPARHQTPS